MIQWKTTHKFNTSKEELDMTSDAIRAIGLLLGFIGLMSWGVLETFWPTPRRIKPPKGGKAVSVARFQSTRKISHLAKAKDCPNA